MIVENKKSVLMKDNTSNPLMEEALTVIPA